MRCNYYDEYLSCDKEDLCERYIKFKGTENYYLENAQLFC